MKQNDRSLERTLLSTAFMLLISTVLSAPSFSLQHGAVIVQRQGEILSDVPQKADAKVRYLFYLHGRIVEQSRRPTSPDFGVYEYDQILDTFKQHGFVVISEQRRKGTDVEEYARRVAGQVRRLLESGVPAENVTVVGASQGSFIAMLASTYLKNRTLNFVVIAGCAGDEGFVQLADLHGNVLFISERSDRPASCKRLRDDATGLGESKEVETNTGLRHGFLYRPLKEWVEPTIAWAQTHSKRRD
jgi:pimeloyl-ACP methyl ester carboxylesterase